MLCTVCISLVYTALQVLKKYEDEFFKVVVPNKFDLHRLYYNGVVNEQIMHWIIGANSNHEAQELLYEHLTRHADVNMLSDYCKVISEASGYHRMQELGRKMLSELMQEGVLG